MADGENYIQAEQYITFYNVTGLIERDKNIYYAPQVSSLLQQDKYFVCEAYKSLFDSVCPPPSSDYKDMKISQWNPEDRKLRVRGSVDSFRKGSGIRASVEVTPTLNYAVLKVDKSSRTHPTFYYGFFITGAFQSGVNTVELTLLPDFFTNTFYWGNTSQLTSDFDPFNSLIANAFIERQHYDRVKVISRTYLNEGDDEEQPSSYEANKPCYLSGWQIGNRESEDYESGDRVSLFTYISVSQLQTIYVNGITLEKRNKNDYSLVSTDTICGVEVDFALETIRVCKQQGTSGTYIISETVTFSDYQSGSWRYVINLSQIGTIIHDNHYGSITFNFIDLLAYPVTASQLSDLDNMDIFVKTEESYNYRQMFKDLRVPVNFNTDRVRFGYDNVVNKIPAEAYTKKTVAEARTYLHYLCSDGVGRADEADAICQACIHYLHIITNEQITYPTIIEGNTGDTSNPKQYYQAWYNKDFEVENDFPSASQHIVVPFIVQTKGLEAFARYLDGEWITAGTTSEVTHGIAIHAYYKNLVVRPQLIGGSNFVTYYDSKVFSQYISEINDKYGYYIQSMFVTPYSELPCSYSWEEDCVVFNGKLVNDDIDPTSPLIRKRRGGTWWSGYTYKKIYSPTKVIEDYDNAVVISPTVVMLPLNKIEVNSNQTEFSSIPAVIYELTGTIASPTGCYLKTYTDHGGTKTYYDDYIMGFGFLVGTKGFEKTDGSGDTYRQVLDIEYSLSTETLVRNFYEPVLEMEPYSFYSLSMSEIETALDRKRYYQMEDGNPVYSDIDVFSRHYKIPLYYNQAVNTMVKIGVIPEYTINSISQRYYNDELMFVTTSGVTVKVDSYSSFMYVMSPQLKAQSHLAVYNAQKDMEKALINGLASTIAGAASQNPAGAVQGIAGILTQQITNEQNLHNVSTNIKAQKASAGNKADTFQQAGSDYIYELNLNEYNVMLNHYRIDELSYNSISKMLERYGYYVNLYDHLNIYNRKGYNYIKLAGFDFNESSIKVTDEQMKSIDTIFKAGVTLLHEKDYLESSSHNYEVSLDNIE